MVTRLQLWHRTASGRGFVQYGFRWFNLPAANNAGVCAGAAKEWLDHYDTNYNGSGTFWANYSSIGADLGPIVNLHNNRGQMLRTIAPQPGVVASGPSGPSALDPAPFPLMFCRADFSKIASSHAIAASRSPAFLFDPNFGEFHVGNGHYQTFSQLWTDLWDYYDIGTVSVYSVT